MQTSQLSILVSTLAIVGISVIASPAAGSASAEAKSIEKSVESSRAHLADSTWPLPAADLWRSSTATGAGLPANLNTGDLVTRSVELPPLPFYGVTCSDNAVYILGGSPAFMELFSSAVNGTSQNELVAILEELLAEGGGFFDMIPYVAKVDLDTFHVNKLELPKGTTINYIGGIVAHENGKLYVVATSKLFEIDPISMELTRPPIDLPKILSQNPLFTGTFFTTYNGIQVSPTTGNIILKAVDFSGYNPTGVMFEVDPETLAIRNVSYADVGTSRMTVGARHGKAYIYLPGPERSKRFEIADSGFLEDTSWSKPYRTNGDGTTQGTAMIYMGPEKSVVWTGNGTILLDVTSPLGLYSQSTVNQRPVTIKTSVSTTEPGGSFFMPVGDPFRSGIVVAQDAVNGILAGWKAGQNGKLRKIWETDCYLSSTGPAIAADQGQLYIDDRRYDSQGNVTLYLVVLDLATGKEIARTEVAGTTTSIAHIFIAGDGVFFIASELGQSHGFLTEVRAREHHGRGHGHGWRARLRHPFPSWNHR